MGIGTALITAPAASAAPIPTTLQAAVSDHKAVTSMGGTTESGNRGSNCITYTTASGSSSSVGGSARWSSTTLSTNESLSGHGASNEDNCSPGNVVVTNSDSRSAQSAVGIKPTAGTINVNDGVAFPLAKVNHYNNSIASSSTTSNFFTGNLKVSMTGFDGTPVLTFPWAMWETPNNTNPCPGGDSGSCDDEIKFTSQVSDQTLTKDGLKYRLVIEGFVPTSAATCPNTMGTNVKNDFWTNEGAITGACIYASVVQIRELTVNKVVAGINPPSQAFNFTSTGALDGSVWKNGSSAVTPTVVGTPVEVFKKELLRSDKVTVVEAAVSDSRWQLTGMACTQKDAAGNDQPVTGVTTSGRTITLDKVGAPLDTSKPNITCTFTNSFSSGSLTIAKVLDDPGQGLAKADKLYTGSYNCGPNYTGTFSLLAGASKTIDRIPVASSCTVTETAPTGNLVNGSFIWGTPTFAPSNTVVIASGADSKVTITNHITQNKGTFTVTKKVVGPAGGFINTDRQFPVGFTCTLAGSQVANGTLQIKKDGSATSPAIPTGASCALTETLAAATGDFADGSYEWVGTTGTFSPASPVVIGANGSNTNVTLTNNYKRNYGNLAISKKVEGPAGAFADTGKTFAGSYTCGGVNGNFTVKDGGTFTSPANTIPAGSSCTVTETAPSGGLLNASYQWSSATYAPGNATVTVPKDGTATVAVTNHIVQNTGKFSIAKTVSGPEGDKGYTGASSREFTVHYKCTLANGADIQGDLAVTTAATKESPAIPAGYSCVLTETGPTTTPGDFADASYEWIPSTAASFTPGNAVAIGNNTTVAVSLANNYTRAFGTLNLKKVVVGSGYIGTGPNFTVNYNCGPTYSGTVKLTAGDGGTTIGGLPANVICTLSEAAPAGNLLDAAHKWGAASWNPSSAQVAIVKNQTVSATVTNPTVAIFGGISVVKAIDGGGVNSGVVFDLTVSCTNGYAKTFSGTAGTIGTTDALPVGTECTVDEAALPTGGGVFVDDSYTWDTKPAAQKVKVAAENQIVPVTVTNTSKRVYGSLLVAKTLVDPDGVYAGAPNNGAAFSGTWSCTYGDAPSGSGSWSAAAGAAATVVGAGILLGSTCSVVETAPVRAPSTDTSYSWGTPALTPNGGVVVLSAAIPAATVQVTNTINRSTGLFSVTKGVTGPLEGFPADSAFQFSWACEKDTWAGANGVFALANGESWDGPGAGTPIPAGASCTVTEGGFPAANPSYTWDGVAFAAAGAGANGTQNGKSFTFTVPVSTVEAPKPVHVTATNALSRKFGSVTVAKTVDAGYDAASGYKFTIRLDCGSNGAFSADVAGGTSATIGNIPLGSVCAVSEDTRSGGLVDGSFAWDTATFTPSTATISQTDSPVAVTVHNPTKRVYGELVINKELAGLSQVVDPQRLYAGGWQCVYGTDAPVTGAWSVKAGMTTSAGQPILIGSVCKITAEGDLAPPNVDPSYVWAKPVFSAPSVVGTTPASLTVTNEVKRNTGSIIVTKKISGETAGLKPGQQFTMVYSCSAVGVTGTMAGQVLVSPDAETTLLDNVPFGWSCAISESAPTADQLKDVSYSWGAVTGAPTTVVLAQGNNPAKVTVTNNIVRNLGTVELRKVLTGPTGIVPAGKAYSGTFTCSYGGTVINNGSWSTTAGSPAIQLATGLPLSTSCTATEDALGAPSNDPSYTWAPAKASIATVTAGAPAVIEVTNTLVRNMGSLTVSKLVTGSATEQAGYIGGGEAKFTINYSCTVPGQTGIAAITGFASVANGGTVTLAEGTIPFGWNCAFTESTPHQDLLADSSFAWGPATITPASATLTAENPAVSVHVENPIIRVKGSVQVSKILAGPDNAGAVAADRDYTGTWSCTYGEGTNAVVIDGSWSAKAGVSAATVSEDVLLNSDCVIAEDTLAAPVPNDPSYRWVSSVPSNDSVELGSPAKLVMTNTFTRDSGSFTVTKKVDGAGYTGTANDKIFTVNYNCGVGYTGTLALGKDGTATVDGIPAQHECELNEELPTGNLEAAYKWIPGTWSANVVDGKITIASDKAVAATITNHTQGIFGTISVVKELAGSGGVAQGKTFTVNVVCTNGYSGVLTMAANAPAKATSNIPVGTECTVTEVTPTGGLVDDSYGWAATPLPQTVKITAENQVVPVTVTNTSERRYGTLNVAKKLVDPDGAYKGGNFAGTWSCTYGTGDGAVVKNGSWSVKAGDPATAVGSGILLGSSCHVAENELPAHPGEDTSYIWAPSYTPAQDVVLTTTNPHGQVTVTNTITRLTGSFAVTKSLAGTGVALGVVPGTTFDFSFKCTGTGWAGAEGNFTLTPGSGSWHPSETIPAGASCTVTEKADPATTGPSFSWDGVEFSVDGSATEPAVGERQVTFTIPAPRDGQVQTLAVAATNTISEKFGDVVVTKKLAGATQGYDGKQDFTINLSCGDAGAQSLKLKALNGSNSTTLKLPIGTKCTVSESALDANGGLVDSSYAWTGVDISNGTFTVSSQTTALAVDVTNTIGRVTGSVDVAKKVTGPQGVLSPERLYTGTWRCTYPDEPAVTGTWSLAQDATSIPVTGIMLNSVCAVTEDEVSAPSVDPSYRWSAPTFAGATVTTAGTPAHLVVTNNLVRDTGTIKVAKTVTGAVGGFTGGDQDVFDIGYRCTVEGVEAPLTGSAKVANGETVTLPGSVPFGWSCTIAEVQPTGNLSDGSFAWETPQLDTPTVVLTADAPTVTVAVENPIKRVQGSVSVKKVVTGPAAALVPADTEFTGSLLCTYGTDEPVTKAWSATVETPAVVTGILVGSSCAVTEKAPTAGPVADDPSMTWLPPILPADVTVVAGEIPNIATVTNPTEQLFGDFAITKSVTGAANGVSADAKYTFEWTCTPAGFAVPISGTATIGNGETWQLPPLVMVPRGSSCTVTENPDSRPETVDAAYTWEPVEYTVAGAEGAQTGSSTTFAVPADGTKVLVSAANPIARAYGAFTVTKGSNPASGSTVKIGEKITYTLTAANTSKVPVHDVVLTDDLKSVMAASSLLGSPQQTQGSSAIAGQILSWNVGTLAAGETQTLSYTVQVNAGSGNATITNVVLGSGDVPPASCAAAVAAARSMATDGQTPSAQAPCGTTHTVALPVVPPVAPPAPPAPPLAVTGATGLWILGLGALLLAGGLGIMMANRRREEKIL